MFASEPVKAKKPEENIIKNFVHKFIPYLPLFAVLGILLLGLTYAYGKWIQRRYEINASILIQDEKKGIDESKMLEALDIFRGKTIVENEVEILKSRKFVKQVVQNLGLYAQVYRKERYRTASVYSLSPVKIQFREPAKLVNTEVPIPLEYDKASKAIKFDGESVPVNKWINTKYGEAIFFLNPSFKADEEAYKYEVMLFQPKMIEQQILNGLLVNTENKLASVVELTIEDADPKRGEDILNEMLDAYVKSEIEEKNILASGVLASVEDRLRYIAGQLDSVETVIQQYRTNAGIIDISTQGRLYLENVGQYDRMVQDVNIKMGVLDAVEKYVESNTTSSGLLASDLGVEDPTLSQMLNKLNEAQLQYDKLKRTTAENSPLILPIKEQIDRLKPSISAVLRNQRNSLQLTKNNLVSNSNKYSTMLNTIPTKEKQLVEISRQQSIKNQIYGYLLERREEAALSYAAARPESRIIDRAEASLKPVSPKMMYLYIAALFFAGLLGLAWIVLKEGLNKSILFRKEVEDTTSMKCIGELFHTKLSSPLFYLQQPESDIAHQIKSLRNQLFFANDGSSVPKLMVASFLPNEGKAILSSNLAISLAATGKKVLLVDADMETAGVSGYFNLESKQGLTDIINRNISVDAVVSKAAEVDNLYVLPIGNTGDSAIEFVNNKLPQLFEQLQQQFDHIIICGGPLSSNADMQVISKLCDMTLVVVRHGKTPLKSNILLDDSIASEFINKGAVVFNDVRKRGWLGGRFAYGAGYGYGIDIKR
jgi:capsular exopolysaccharide synthesis family protein